MDQKPDWMDDMMNRIAGGTDQERAAYQAVAKLTLLHYRAARMEGATISEAAAATASFVLAYMLRGDDGKGS